MVSPILTPELAPTPELMPSSSPLTTPIHQICPFVSAAGIAAILHCSVKPLPLTRFHFPLQTRKPTSIRSVSPLAPRHPGDHLKAAVQCLLLTQSIGTILHSKHPSPDGTPASSDSFFLQPPDFCRCLAHHSLSFSPASLDSLAHSLQQDVPQLQ